MPAYLSPFLLSFPSTAKGEQVTLFLFSDRFVVQMAAEGDEGDAGVPHTVLDIPVDVMWVRDIPFRTLHAFEVRYKRHVDTEVRSVMMMLL